MKEYNVLPLYRESEKLVTMIVKMMGKTTRQYRYTFGERMVEGALQLPMDFYRLYTTQDTEEKIRLTDVFIANLAELKMLVDIGHQLGLFTYKDFPLLLEQLDTIERQINGFKNKNARVHVIKGDK